MSDLNTLDQNIELPDMDLKVIEEYRENGYRRKFTDSEKQKIINIVDDCILGRDSDEIDYGFEIFTHDLKYPLSWGVKQLLIQRLKHPKYLDYQGKFRS